MNAVKLDQAIEKHYSRLFNKEVDLMKEKYSGWDRMDVTELNEKQTKLWLLFKLKAGKIHTGYYGSRRYILY